MADGALCEELLCLYSKVAAGQIEKLACSSNCVYVRQI